MYLLIVTLPLLGSAVSGLCGRWLGARGAAVVTTTCVLLSCILSFIAFYEVALGLSACYIKCAPWFYSEMFDAAWGLLFDSLTVVMLVVVTLVSVRPVDLEVSEEQKDRHFVTNSDWMQVTIPACGHVPQTLRA